MRLKGGEAHPVGRVHVHNAGRERREAVHYARGWRPAAAARVDGEGHQAAELHRAGKK